MIPFFLVVTLLTFISPTAPLISHFELGFFFCRAFPVFFPVPGHLVMPCGAVRLSLSLTIDGAARDFFRPAFFLAPLTGIRRISLYPSAAVLNFPSVFRPRQAVMAT